MVNTDAVVQLSGKTAYSRRRHATRARAAVRPTSKTPCSHVQPGQLASPYLKFGFPSLALH